MQIAHVLSSFGLGGQERVAYELGRRQRKDGHTVIAVSLAGEPEGPLAARFRAEAVGTISLSRRAGLDPTLLFRLARLLESEHVEIVHTHNPQALVYGAPAARLARVPVLHTKHGLNPDPPRRQLLRRLAASQVDAYVAVTPMLAEVARQRRECDSARIRVVPNGIDGAELVADPETRRSVRQELGIPEEAWVVGSVGRLSAEKDQGLLIDALASELGREVRLVLVGDGPERASLEARIARTGRSEWVHLTGARDDVPRLLSAFDVFALPSRSEGLPLVLLEAMAASLPVVATRVGGVPDLVESALTGLLVDSGDEKALGEALHCLEWDPERAREMGRMGRQRVLARYSIEQMVKAYQALYSEILARQRLTRAGALAGARSP